MTTTTTNTFRSEKLTHTICLFPYIKYKNKTECRYRYMYDTYGHDSRQHVFCIFIQSWQNKNYNVHVSIKKKKYKTQMQLPKTFKNVYLENKENMMYIEGVHRSCSLLRQHQSGHSLHHDLCSKEYKLNQHIVCS